MSALSSRIKALEEGLADEFRKVLEEIDNNAADSEAGVYPLLVRAWEIHNGLFRSGRANWTRWLKAHGVEISQKAAGRFSDNDEFYTLKALYHENDRDTRRRTISRQGQALAYYSKLEEADRRPR